MSGAPAILAGHRFTDCKTDNELPTQLAKMAISGSEWHLNF